MLQWFFSSPLPYIHTVYLDITIVFYSTIDAQVNCLKKIFKFTIKLTLKQLRHVWVQSHYHQCVAMYFNWLF